MNQLNFLVLDYSYFNWTLFYKTQRQKTSYEWMDWSTDNCSVPQEATLIPRIDYYKDHFLYPCLRHDLSWRSLAALEASYTGSGDPLSGYVWNEHNRFIVDRQFHKDMLSKCEAIACEGAADAYHEVIRRWAGFRSDTPPAIYTTSRIAYKSSQVCSHSSNRNNTCLPINYIQFQGKPLAARKYVRLPKGYEYEMQVVYGNQQSVRGGPKTGNSSYRRTRDLHIKATWPLKVSGRSGISCGSTPYGSARITDYYADDSRQPSRSTYTDEKLKRTSIYVKLCERTSSQSCLK